MESNETNPQSGELWDGPVGRVMVEGIIDETKLVYVVLTTGKKFWNRVWTFKKNFKKCVLN